MTLKIYAVGDIMLGEQDLSNNFGVKKIIQENGADFLFEEVIPLFSNGDIIFGNLECSFMDIDSKVGEKNNFLCAEPNVVNALKNAHFNVLSVANNHINGRGREPFIYTIQILKNNGILPVGIRKKYAIKTIKGYRVAILAYSFIEDNIIDVCYNKVQSEETIIVDMQKIRPISDIVIVSLHWGFEYVPYPSPDQIRIGRKLVEAGADIILGGHPHVTQSFEIYKNRPIIYSLGNFIFDQTFIPTTRESFIAEITISDSPDLMNVNIIPIIINNRDYHPQIVNSPQKDAFLKSVGTIRNAFENRSLSDYRESIGDYTLLYNKYMRPAKWSMKKQFIKNFYRYSLSTVYDIIKQYVGKKLGNKI